MIEKLLHEESHKFLTDIGFVARSILGETQRIAYDYPEAVSLVLYRGTKITSFEKLFQVVVDQTYNQGREQGKNDAVGLLMKNFTRIIFDLK
jgi:hypothetical protein